MNHLNERDWVALVIGNSRLHWAWFQGKKLHKVWDSEHIFAPSIDRELLRVILPLSVSDLIVNCPIYIASVVPSQTILWQTYPHINVLTLDKIPLKGIYPTMGIDRALALWGAGIALGFPCLVIDAGTALTFTGANSDRVLIGGAILPGLKLQLQSLATKTAALPEIQLPQTLPNRFAIDTSNAIQSGIIYTILAGICDFIVDWLNQFPQSNIVLTGGDGQLLHSYLKFQFPKLATQIIVDPHLIFWGMQAALGDRL